jgi:hypothetical protein
MNFEKDKYYLVSGWIRDIKYVMRVVSVNSNATLTWTYTENGNKQLMTDHTHTVEKHILIKEGFNSPEEMKDKYPEHFI